MAFRTRVDPASPMLKRQSARWTAMVRRAARDGIALPLLLGLVPTQAEAQTTPVQIEQPVRVDNVHDLLDWLVAAAQIVASLSALAALIFLALQVKGARDDANAQRALAFQEKYTSREFSRIVSPVLAYLRVDGAADCIDKIRAHRTAAHAEAKCLLRTPRDAAAPQPS